MAGIITLENADFELPNTGKISTGFAAVPGWNNTGTSAYVNSGVDKSSTKYGSDTSYIGFFYKTDGAGAVQMTSHVIAENETFTVTYSNMNGFNSGVTAGITQGKCVLYYLSDVGAMVALGFVQTDRDTAYADTYWSPVTLTVDATAAAVGKTLGVQFRATNGWTFVDDVSLTYQTVPEPGSLAVLIAGVLGLGTCGWRRKR